MFAMQKAVPGASNDVSITGSKTIALGFFGEDQSEASIANSPTPFQFTIPRDTSIPLPEFTPLYDANATRISEKLNLTKVNKGPVNLLLLSGFMVSKKNVSIHYHIEPYDESAGYFAALYFGGNPYLNKTFQRYHMWRVFCPWSKFIILILLLSYLLIYFI